MNIEEELQRAQQELQNEMNQNQIDNANVES